MRLQVLIPCAGTSHRWRNHLGIPKQLAPLPGGQDTILSRTIRLLKEHGVNDIHAITHDEVIASRTLGVHIIHPDSRVHLSDTLLSGKAVWGDRTVVLLGDVFFTRKTIESILQGDSDIQFYGTLAESHVVRSLGYRKEVFGFSFNKTRAERIRSALELNAVLADIRDAGGSRFLLHPQRLRLLRSGQFRYTGDRIIPHELSTLFLKFNYSPNPLFRLRDLGLRPHTAWRWIRKILPLVGGGSMFFGKLWGLYALIAGIDPSREPIRIRREQDHLFFKEISDHTRDCDSPADYDRIVTMLTASSEID